MIGKQKKQALFLENMIVTNLNYTEAAKFSDIPISLYYSWVKFDNRFKMLEDKAAQAEARAVQAEARAAQAEARAAQAEARAAQAEQLFPLIRRVGRFCKKFF